MLSKTLNEVINEQIKWEFGSAYLYLAMADYFHGQRLTGCAHWMRLQSAEELEHAMKFVDYVHERSGRVVLQALDRPQGDYASPLAIFQAALAHEREVTQRINHLYELASEEPDYATQTFLHWFVTEQVEEEKNAGEVVDQLTLAGDDSAALLVVDQRLATRQ
jgi:ferritin